MTSRRWTAIAIVTIGLWPAVALAHPDVDEGRRLFEEAEFLDSLDAFARAEAASDLEPAELVTLLETRALVHLAMGNTEPMRADLARLAVVAPDHALDRRAPPEVRRAFAELRAQSAGPVRLRLSPEPSSAGVTIRAQAENDPLSLVRGVRIYGRAVDATSWEEATDAPLLVAASGVVAYYAEALGPGGVPLATAGSRDAPLRYAGAGPSGDEAAVSAGGDDSTAWIVVGVVAAVLAVGAGVTVAVLLTSDGSSGPTQVQPFTVRF